MAKKVEAAPGFMAEKWGTRDDLRDIGQELKDQLNTYDKIEDIVNKRGYKDDKGNFFPLSTRNEGIIDTYISPYK